MSAHVRHVAILVEGQSEEGFVRDVLSPRAARHAVYLTPIVVHTSEKGGRVHRGGGGWSGYARQLDEFSRQPHWHAIALLCDFYAYPQDAPGAGTQAKGRERHQELVAALHASWPGPRFRPCLVMHEFETLVLAALLEDPSLFPPTSAIRKLRDTVAAIDDVETINESVQTSPSHRLRAAWPEYQKAIDGLRILSAVDLGAVLDRCPTVRAWWHQILELPESA